MIIYVNGQFIEAERAVISPYDHGYLYGLGVFETFRVYRGHPFLFDDHYERLMTALSHLNIVWSLQKEDVLAILRELLEQNGIQDAYIRFNVSAGVGEIGLQTDCYENPSVIAFIKPLPVSDAVIEKEGIILKQRRNTPEGPFRLKSHHYLNNILGKREAGNDPLKEGMFLTEQGHVAEGVVSNIFFVKDKVLCTPSLETGILNGITREFLLALAQQLGIQSKEGLFTERELLESDEVFVTNSIQELVPIRAIGLRRLPGKEGAAFNILSEAYRSYRYTLWSKHELEKGGC